MYMYICVYIYICMYIYIYIYIYIYPVDVRWTTFGSCARLACHRQRSTLSNVRCTACSTTSSGLASFSGAVQGVGGTGHPSKEVTTYWTQAGQVLAVHNVDGGTCCRVVQFVRFFCVQMSHPPLARVHLIGCQGHAKSNDKPSGAR